MLAVSIKLHHHQGSSYCLKSSIRMFSTSLGDISQFCRIIISMRKMICKRRAQSVHGGAIQPGQHSAVCCRARFQPPPAIYGRIIGRVHVFLLVMRIYGSLLDSGYQKRCLKFGP